MTPCGGKENNMRKLSFVMAGILFIATVTTVSAQGWRGSGGWGMGGSYQRMFNPATVETVSGEVSAVIRMTHKKGMGTGIHLQIKSDKETISVHLGPAWYIERLDTKIEKGDMIEVKGSRISFDGKPAIIAAEVKKGEATLILRDAAGVPVWSGWRR
jgi:hypothetical protein